MPNEVKLLPCVTILGVEQPKRIWLMCYRHAGDICWTSDPNPDDADEIETVEYVRADTRPTIVTDEVVERVARAIFDAENGLDGDCVGDMIYQDFRVEGADVAENQRQTMIVCRQAARSAIAAMPAIVGGE